jgi:hypothetical protein
MLSDVPSQWATEFGGESSLVLFGMIETRLNTTSVNGLMTTSGSGTSRQATAFALLITDAAMTLH